MSNRCGNGSLPSVRPADEYAGGENAKKKTKKWSFGGLFRRKRTNKSSDTDDSSSSSGSETDDKKRGGFLKRSHHRRRHKGGGARRVVGKFETKMMTNGVEVAKARGELLPNGIEIYEASPIVIKRTLNIDLPNGVSHSCQEIAGGSGGGRGRADSLEFAKGSCGSLDVTGRGRHGVKARAEARRVRLKDESSSSEDCGSSKTSNSSSLQRGGGGGGEQPTTRGSAGSLNRRSRTARTERYAKRHYREEDGRCCSNTELRSQPVGSPKNRWVANVVYRQSSDYHSPRTQYADRAQSATTSPVGSPVSRTRNLYCSSLPYKTSAADANHELFRMMSPPSRTTTTTSTYGRVRSPKSAESLPKLCPPPPPPRNTSRKIAYPVDVCANRPSSYAFDANAKAKDIVSYVSNGRSTGYTNDGESRLRQKSNSDVELRGNDRSANNARPDVRATVQRYCADKKPRSRNPIQLVNDTENAVRVTNSVPDRLHATSPSFAPRTSPHQTAHRNDVNLSKANEIGIPVINKDSAYERLFGANSTHGAKPDPRFRPLSVVSENADNELANDVDHKRPSPKVVARNQQQKPKNLEEALVELEEIYNRLKLSDEDLLDRADRRDLQSAIRMNSNFSRHSWNDLESAADQADGKPRSSGREYADTGLLSPRLPTGRRAVKPDTVADDMAYRKLNKKDNQDAKSTSNVVSQSGSFLLCSPALSPPPLVNIPPPPAMQLNPEPDVTLDDVVFRNIRQANSTLKVQDPQPPFGIPLGPISPAANSDYLHASPGEKYRSTFNPSRTPDVVKDDLAFRNLRKDVRGGPDMAKQYVLPSSAAAAKKRRAIRSLSANVVSLIGKHGSDRDDEDDLVDVNCNNLRKSDRCASFNNLPDVLVDYEAQKLALLRNCDECLGSQQQQQQPAKDPTFDLIADEAKVLSRELRRKLRELEAIPLCNKFEEPKNADAKPATNNVKRVAVHKPITLSRFRIDEMGDERACRKEDAPQLTAERVSRTTRTTDDTKTEEPRATGQDRQNVFGLKTLCQNLNWNGVICAPYHPKQTVLNEGECECHRDEPSSSSSGVDNDVPTKPPDVENSSSGVSSTSETPDSSRRSETGNFCPGVYRSFPLDTPSPVPAEAATEAYLGQNVFPSFEDASQQYSNELHQDAPDVRASGSKSRLSNGDAPAPRKSHCSKIEITLSTPEIAGSR